MLFHFGPYSSLLLPFVGTGVLAVGWLAGRAWWRAAAPDAWLALLVLLPTLSVAQWMLGFADWYDSHDGYTTAMFYVPWQLGLLTGPAYYGYFRSLTQAAQPLRSTWPHLLLGGGQLGLFGVAAAYDLLWWRGLRHRPLPDFFATKGHAAVLLSRLELPLTLAGYASLLGYSLRVLADYRRYHRYLDDHFSAPERLRFAGLRQLLLLQVVSLGLGLGFTGFNEVATLSYQVAWYFYAVQGYLIYGLLVVGLQANYAAASQPLHFAGATFWPSHPGELPVASTRAEGASPALPLAEAAQNEPARRPGEASSLPPELQPYRDRLLRLMDEEQLWLRPELTLAELAQALHLGPAGLSRVINTGCGCNFSDFVNGYRVRAARERLADPRYAHYSLLGIAFDCGFNSKATFNRVFKKLAGCPPSDLLRPTA